MTLHSKWDSSLTGVFSDRTIKQFIQESLRKYKLNMYLKVLLWKDIQKKDIMEITLFILCKTPTYTGEESGYKYHLFNRWDKSGLTGDFDENGVKTVNAILRFIWIETMHL